MQKKLLAVAVAGALFSPLAMAQSSVTISGVFKVGIDNYKISNSNAAHPSGIGRAAGLNRSETRITDNSSRMIFGISEDLGGGLAGIAQLDARFQPDDAGGGFAESGNTWVGIRSSSLGTLTFGRHDLHYGKQPDDVAAKAGALMAASVSLMDHTWLTGAVTSAAAAAAAAAAPAVAIASATRTPNVVRWDSPNWSGFALTVAYSTSPFGNESDLQTGGRKGNAWNFNPSFTSGPFQVGASMWKAKGDGAASVPLVAFDQDSLALYGYYRLGAFKIGAAMNDSEVELHGVNALIGGTAGTSTKIVDRRAWTIPASWTMGPHTVAGHYTRAGKDKAASNLGVDQTAAKMFAVIYNYDLSKRTAIGLTYASINNDENASYNFFTNTGGLGSTASSALPGEDQKLMAFTVRHAF